jgi:hypothetical protein
VPELTSQPEGEGTRRISRRFLRRIQEAAGARHWRSRLCLQPSQAAWHTHPVRIDKPGSGTRAIFAPGGDVESLYQVACWRRGLRGAVAGLAEAGLSGSRDGGLISARRR